MSLTYAIADLHGRHDLLLKAIGAIVDHAGMRDFRTVTLGDYVDRGPESRQVIEYLMTLQERGASLICLKGNHEDIMVTTLAEPLDPSWWMGQGGSKTMYSYGHPKMRLHSGTVRPFRASVVPKEHTEWITALPTMHVDQHRVFVHAGVDPNRPLNLQNADQMLWMIYPAGEDLGHGDRHVVHGHHASRGGPVLYSNRTCLDTEAYSTGRLVVGVFDDDIAGGPIDLIEVVGDPQ